jgi:hypothetical protein
MHHTDSLPSVSQNYLSQNNAVHEYETRQSRRLHMPRIITVFGQLCINNVKVVFMVKHLVPDCLSVAVD